MLTILRGIGVCLVMLVILLLARWSSLVSIGIRHDLREYAKAVRACDAILADKERLLDRIDALERRLEEGATLSMFQWQVHNEAIRLMLDDGIPGDEVRLIERELEKVELELNQ